MSDLSPLCDQGRTSTVRDKNPHSAIEFDLALRLLSSATRWSAAVAAPLCSIFATMSASGQTALDFCDPFIAAGGLRCPDNAAAA